MPHSDCNQIDQISQAMGRMRVLIGRRVLGRRALDNLAPGLDLSDLDVLALVPSGAAAAGISVGDIARQLRIDPSRASRLVAGLVDGGFLQREVAQQDARRAVLCRSAKGDAIFAEIQRMKHEAIAQIVSAWPEGDRADFARSFDAFVSAFEALSPPD